MDEHGLPHDLQTLARQAERRRALRWMAGLGGLGAVGVLPLLGCGGGDDEALAATSSSSSGSGSSSSGSSSGSCALIPEETAGPYPGDGSNSTSAGVANALMLSGIVRSDIRSSIAGTSGTAGGVPLTLKLQLVNTAAGCASLAGYAIYLWHCDREGRYSMYSSGVTDQNYLRGLQATDSDGIASFGSIFPGCYDGRMPHVHFEIYRSINSATSFSKRLRTSQLTFPLAACNEVYATSGYGTSVANLARISFASDNVFSDGTTLQMSSVSGNVTDGYVATLMVGLSA
ncbi:intradiol ring-cleavage dioxygenase [Rivibacter subsaxonicus]|uniref:Dioxygenase-like protein n=1 Tax=Rivibacter subsaxonicus TaxID=457575 RepID=A0A4Q7VZN5_9BURK|nr:intradiol ring-cleavage dioxygenase [Rivibacter subsaxonicus]RZU02351.1 dioxygenase-like protein [Rivibacter subsaxonicus]